MTVKEMEKLDSALEAPSRRWRSRARNGQTDNQRKRDGGIRAVALELLLVSELTHAAVVAARPAKPIWPACVPSERFLTVGRFFLLFFSVYLLYLSLAAHNLST
jgi:hypothetical protein